MARAGKWTADEDIKLKDAVHTHGGKNWNAIAMLVPSRTKKQCGNRWRDISDPNIGGANRRTGKWAVAEVAKLNNAVY
jgi:myb proto-oncogene protein